MPYAPMLLVLAGFRIGASPGECPEPGPGVRDIQAFGYYTDAAGSVRDAARYQATHVLTRPFEDFAAQVCRLADRFLAGGDPAAAACTVAWLDRWAQDGAMLGAMIKVDNDQPEYVRAWTHASVAIAWNKVRAQAPGPERARVDAWLQALSRATLACWSGRPGKIRNNHFYWAGVGVMATAVATQDAGLLAEARRIYETGLDAIRDDGTLPYEMRRGIRALHYHAFAAMPLVMLAEMARRAGLAWFDLRDRRLDLLVRRIAAGLRDPADFARVAGAAPQVVPPRNRLSWVLLYRAHAPWGERFEGLFEPADGSFIRELGGDLGLILAKGVFDPR